MADSSVKKAILAAGAQGGKRGADAYSQALGNINADRQQALNDAAARAGALNAPQAFINKQAAIAAMPGDATAPLVQALQRGNSNALGTLRAAQGSYAGSVANSRNQLAQQASAAGEDPMLHLQAADKAASLYEKLLKQANGGVSPAEQRAAQQFKWAEEAHQKKVDDDFAASQQNKLERSWATSQNPYDNTAFGVISDNDNYTSAVKDLQSGQYKKEWKKLQPADQQAILDRLEQYYDPSGYMKRNSVSTIDILNSLGQ